MTPLLTTRELAEYLGTTPTSVLRWHREDKLPGFKLPSGAIRFDKGEIENWLAECRTGDQGGGRLELVGEKERSAS